MPRYRIYRMKDAPRQQFRWSPHVSGAASVKRRDYEEHGVVEAANEYDAWRGLRGSEQALDIGDLLESDAGDLRICKYVGFEAAHWHVPEPKPEPDAPSPPPELTGEAGGHSSQAV